ncbi:MAG TPA: aminotransferase class I/II-fold pyridoxal phosphate-dependent enzyme [Anaerolineales bacterium]|nr:aminotransferase class I/II-fold pyridoxal phosphate-dependent enzyme [Anaerolineales bacterium]
MSTDVTTEYLSRRVVGLKPSGIRKFFDIVATMQDVISLGIGEPDFATPEPILKAGIRSLEAGETHYTSNAGTFELRQALAAHLNRLYAVSYDPLREMVITVGVSEALYLAMTALLDPGEEVIIPTPCFVAYQAEVILAGGAPVEIPTRAEDGFQLRPEALEAAITPRTKLILLGYPNNPTGAVATRQALLEVARLAEKYNLLVVSDELYDQLVYGVPHVCFASLPGMKKRTVLLGGFSKNYAMTGWRIGFAAAPADILRGLLRVHQYTIMSAPTTAQTAALEAIENGAPHVEEMRVEYNRRRELIVSGLNELGLATVEPHGAFYAFPSIAASGMDEETFAQKLLDEERVAVVPGSAFGPGGEGYVRCSYATAYEKIEEALNRIRRFMTRYG